MLRALAVVLVIYNHSMIICMDDKFTRSVQVNFLYTQFWMSIGLDLFFVISGLIMVIVTRSYIKNPGGWFNFMLKRIVRIIPLYWLYSGFVYVERHLLHHPVSTGQIVKTIVFFPVFAAKNAVYPIIDQGWSLSYELFFYLLIVVFLFFKAKKPFYGLLITTVVLAVLGYMVNPASTGLKFITTPILLEFALGMAVGIAYHYVTLHHGHTKQLLIKYAGIAATVVGLVLMLSSLYYKGNYISDPAFIIGNNVIAMYRSLIWGLPCAIFVLGILFWEYTYRPVIPSILIKIGDASFTAYLAHVVIIVAMGKVYGKIGFANGDAFIIASTILSILISLPLYDHIEKPFLKFCNRLAFRGEKKLATV
jgi:peptidoglycan/LPS O-acetylase OafA/YrhL